MTKLERASTLDLRRANRIVELAVQRAAELGVPPLTVVVLDDAGHLVAAQRQDGASMFRFDVAVGKAWGAVAMGGSSRSLAERAEGNPNFFAALAATAHGRFLPQPGAVLVQADDRTVLGAVGASGGTGDEDEVCCAFGVTEAGFLPVGAGADA
ncbi:GlcG/HbpS family heme-binding protein [Microlunatus antarcticus]